MKLIVEIKIASNFFRDKKGKTPTFYATALSLLDKLFVSNSFVQKISLLTLIDDNDETLHEIVIDLFGVLRVVGAVAFNDSTGTTHRLLVVDEGASYLLFELKDNKALFQGALTGMELDSFESKKPGHTFSYYRRVYKKLRDKQISELIDPTLIYQYDTGERFESPRKASRPIQ